MQKSQALFVDRHLTAEGLRRPTRHGITLLEVLFVIAVLGLLAAVTIPAIQYSRESSRKVTCMSNLRQVMVAFEDFTIKDRHYPGTRGPRGSLQTRSWPKQLLGGLGLPANAEFCPYYACPSDPEHATGGLKKEYHISYRLCTGVSHLSKEGHGVSGDRKGPQNVRDGFSTTVAIGERLSLPWYAPKEVDWQDEKAIWDRGLRRIFKSPEDPEAYFQECHQASGLPYRPWPNGTFYNHVMPPNDNSCILFPTDDNPFAKGGTVALTASSRHPGGVHAGFLDGGVRFIKDDIDRGVWRALGTIDGGEIDVSF